jgi:hypothetical protein
MELASPAVAEYLLRLVITLLSLLLVIEAVAGTYLALQAIARTHRPHGVRPQASGA